MNSSLPEQRIPEAFSRLQGAEFVVNGDGISRNVTLIEVNRSSIPADPDGSNSRDTYSLLFFDASASTTQYLGQGTYQFLHPTLEAEEIFIVPVGPCPDQGGMRYEAVFL